MPETIPRPPWMYNTPYLQNLYQQNRAQIDNAWSTWAAAHPAEAAQFSGQQGQPLPSGGFPNYTPPSGGNMPMSNAPYGWNPTGGQYGVPSNNPFGPLSNGQYGGDSSSGGGGNPNAWYNSFLGQTGINTGLNLLGGFLQNRAQKGADKANQKAIEDRIRRALANLSPEHIMALAQQFLPQMAANMSGAGQTAIQAVRAQAARTGQLESPRALSFEAGTRAKLAGDVQTAAFDRAFNLSQNQANAITGAPYAMQQPRTGYADAIANSVNQAYFARAMSGRQPQQPAGVPYAYPYNPNPPQSRNYGLY